MNRNRHAVTVHGSPFTVHRSHQLRITSELGDTPTYQRICEIYDQEGGSIAGTSAGASMMCETMLVRGEQESSARLGASLVMAPGLGLVKNAIIDQHFAQRGRIARLLGAVAHNPRVLDARLCVLSRGDRFELEERKAHAPAAAK